MNHSIIEEVMTIARECSCGHHHSLDIHSIVVKRNAIDDHLAQFLQAQTIQKVVIAVDQNTYRAAGEWVELHLKKHGLEVDCCLISPDPNGDVIADETSIVQLMLNVQHDTDALIAVGAGTIHDIVRFVSFKMEKRFISVPTAPSVDGFASKGAPIIIQGSKETIPASSPIAIFADLHVLQAAPKRLVAAGFGDMLAKYTSLFDWRFGHVTAHEPFCEAAETITEGALMNCVHHIEAIASGEENGIEILMNALIQSGLAMLLFGSSHSASGAEHHLSHFWEMEHLRKGERQMLHGAKVAVAAAEISKLYHDAVTQRRIQLVKEHWGKIDEWIKSVPSGEWMIETMRNVQGPATIADLGIKESLLHSSLQQAHLIRPNRHTLLKWMNTNG